MLRCPADADPAVTPPTLPVRAAMVTIVAGRERHLARQLEGVSAMRPGPDMHIVVAMCTPDRIAAMCPLGTEVLAFERVGDLPLAAARNRGATAALDRGAELLVFLDVDCIPAPALLARYAEAAAQAEHALLCGPVAYLPPGTGPGAPHPARPLPAERELIRGGDHQLFWSLSFATTADTWRSIGGFCEEYVGYGGEDTDFGQLARAAGVDLCWVGGAWSYHQYHPTSSPPVEHLDAIVGNASRFHDRWGWWPMEGWLRALAETGLIGFDATGVRVHRPGRSPRSSTPRSCSPTSMSARCPSAVRTTA